MDERGLVQGLRVGNVRLNLHSQVRRHCTDLIFFNAEISQLAKFTPTRQ